MTFHIIIEGNPGLSSPNAQDNFLDGQMAVRFPNAPRPGSLEALFQTLRALPPAPNRIIQLVGHGSPGNLSMGQAYEKVPEGNGKHFLLDSNPHVHGLLSEVVRAEDEVWLIGCNVGEDPPPPLDVIAGGPTLVFDLAQMWDCTVRASIGVVFAEDFDATGKFKFEDRLIKVEKAGPALPGIVQRNWLSTGRPPPRELPSAPTTQRVRLKRLTRAFVLGSKPTIVPVTLTSQATAALELAFSRRPDPPIGEIPALPEYTFDAEVGPTSGVAEIFLNGRLLRFRAGATVHDFVRTSPSAAQQTLSQLLRAGLGIPVPL